MNKDRKLIHESKTGQLLVGLFVLIAVIGFGWLLITQRQGPDSYVVVAEFDTLGNINAATKVKLRGFTVGKVQGVEFRPSPPEGEAYFLVKLGIEKKYPVPKGTVAEIRSSGLVGEAYVHLNLENAKLDPVLPGSHISGHSDPGMKPLMAKVKEAAMKLGGAGQAIKNAELGGKLGILGKIVSRIAHDLGKVSNSADSLLVTSRHMVRGMEPGLNNTLDGLNSSMARMSLTFGRTDTLVAATSEDLQKSVRALRLMVERMDRVLQRVDTLVQHKQKEIDETVSNLHAASESVREISEHPWKLLTGQGKSADSTENTVTESQLVITGSEP